MWGFLNFWLPSLPGSDLMAIARSENSNLHVFFLQIEEGPSSPSGHHENAANEKDISFESINTEVEYEPRSKKIRIISDMPVDKFREEYMIVGKQKTTVRDIPVIVPKIDCPPWLKNLGEVDFKENLWTVQIPDILVSHVAGYLHSPKKEFTVASDTSLLKESSSLLTIKLNSPPRHIKSNTSLF